MYLLCREEVIFISGPRILAAANLILGLPYRQDNARGGRRIIQYFRQPGRRRRFYTTAAQKREMEKLLPLHSS